MQYERADVLPTMVYLRYLSQEVCTAHVTSSDAVGEIRVPITHPEETLSSVGILLVSNCSFVVPTFWGSYSLCRCDEHWLPGARSAFLLLLFPALVPASEAPFPVQRLIVDNHGNGRGVALRQERGNLRRKTYA